MTSGSAWAQHIVYDQTDLLNQYDSECYEQNISFFASVGCTEEISGSFNPLPLYLNTVHNTTYARGLNNGPAWQGKGANLTASFGFSGRTGNLTYVIGPMIQYVQNLDFNTGADQSDRPPYQYPFNSSIDYITRYGSDPGLFLFPGQSEVALTLEHVTFSLSTQNMRWGPAIYNPIIMSTNAGGMPHLRIGTTKPLEAGIGRFEGNIMWGLLRESDYFNDDPDDNIRYFSGITIGYEPSFFDGFSISFQRIFYTQTQYLTGVVRDGLTVFSGFLGDQGQVVDGREFANDVYDQIASLTMSYENKAENLKLYWEWARGDFADTIVHYLEAPEDNSGYTIGMWKRFDLGGDRKIRMVVEHSDLATWETRFNLGLPVGSFYAHGINKQGYTNNGQVVGASIGPGSSAHNLNLSYIWPDKQLTFEYQRTRYNDDYFYTTFDSRESTPQDLEHQLGLRYETSVSPNLSVNVGLFAAVRDNYLYNDETVKFNMHSNLSMRYRF
ncbi:MAG: capsule assembly Wzi family protein [Balneolaceae bacterium]|nr:capsule assembly Wzi family protein [Balneolaceae bacterium]